MSIGEWRSLVARAVWDREVAGSNPVSPTTRNLEALASFFIIANVRPNVDNS